MPEPFAHPVPDNISDDAAALLEPLSVGVWACRRGQVAPVHGARSPAPARSGWSACRRLSPTEPPRSWSVTSMRIGSPLPRDWGPPMSWTCRRCRRPRPASSPTCCWSARAIARATTDAIRTVARAGRVVLIGMGGDELTLPLSYVQDRELVLTGRSATPTPGPRPSPSWPRDGWTSTRWSLVTTGSTRSRRPSPRRGETRRRSNRSCARWGRDTPRRPGSTGTTG